MRSSAYIRLLIVILPIEGGLLELSNIIGRSLTYMLNNVGLRLSPCLIPVSDWEKGKIFWLLQFCTYSDILLYMDLIMVWKLLDIPHLRILYNRPLCHTVSNACLKSTNAMYKGFFSRLYLAIMFFKINIWSLVLCFFQNPLCSLHTMLLVSRKWHSRLLRIELNNLPVISWIVNVTFLWIETILPMDQLSG